MFFTKKKKPAQSARATPKPSSAEPSFIGRNCVFEGHISCDGELHIDGTVRGTVQANLCVIDEAGVVQGTVNGQIVHVRGRILGPIQGANVFIHAGAHVEGDVFNDTISIENGAYVFGSIRHNTAPPPAPAQPSLLNGATNGDLSPDTANKLRVISNRK